MNELMNIFINRGMNKNEATELINEMRQRVTEGENPEEVLYEEGLEPDYVFELLEYLLYRKYKSGDTEDFLNEDMISPDFD
jgi:hypothetical protein